jgi:hypothetical protein
MVAYEFSRQNQIANGINGFATESLARLRIRKAQLTSIKLQGALRGYPCQNVERDNEK